jgi:rod shape-determining protein MreD
VKIRRIVLLLAGAALLEFFVGGSSHRALLPVDWFLLATAAVARSGDFVRAVLAGAAAGFFEDALSQPLLGVNAFAKATLGFALTLVSVRVVFGGALAVGAALAAASLANEAIVAALSALLLGSPMVVLSRDALWRAAATGIAGGALEAAWEFSWGDWWKRRRLRRLR